MMDVDGYSLFRVYNIDISKIDSVDKYYIKTFEI